MLFTDFFWIRRTINLKDKSFHNSIDWSGLSGDIFGNLRVRISNPWEKCPTRKIFEFIFGLKHLKMTLQKRDVRLQMTWPSTQFALLLPKIALLFLKSDFLFPGIALCFPVVAFYLSKMSYCFPELPFSMPRVTSVLDNLKTEYDLLCILFKF